MWSSVEHGGETIVTFADLLNLISYRDRKLGQEGGLCAGIPKALFLPFSSLTITRYHDIPTESRDGVFS